MARRGFCFKQGEEQGEYEKQDHDARHSGQWRSRQNCTLYIESKFGSADVRLLFNRPVTAFIMALCEDARQQHVAEGNTLDHYWFKFQLSTPDNFFYDQVNRLVHLTVTRRPVWELVRRRGAAECIELFFAPYRLTPELAASAFERVHSQIIGRESAAVSQGWWQGGQDGL